MAFIKAFAGIGKNDAAEAGGKGASLGEMTQAGIPVPPGFVILASTFDRFVEAADLTAEINAALSSVEVNEMHTIDAASERIQGVIKAAAMPEDIAADIRKHFAELGAEFVAVRSSATAEDSASAAWAGQLDTFLNTTEADLLEKVQHCWASLFTPRAIFYRFEKELHDTHISVAVVVQKMVASDVSGIAFSVHPVTEDRNQLIIEASYGLGEAIVSGQVTPDSFVVTKEPREIIDTNIATKDRGMYRKEGGGNEWRETSLERREAQALSNTEVLALADTVVRIEQHYGFPCDIEWAMEAGELYITQSRPITTLSEAALESVVAPSWEVIARDFHSPLFRNEIWVRAWKRFGEQFSVPAPRLGIAAEHDDIRYLAVSSDWKAAHEGIRAKALLDQDFVERTIDETNAYGEEFNAWSKKHLHEADLKAATSDELVALLDEFAKRQAQMYAYGVMLPVLDFGGHAYVEGNLDRILKEKAAPEDYQRYYEVFTTPPHNSFAQDQEEDLLRLMEKHGKDVRAASALAIDEVEREHPNLYGDLVLHADKHAWVYYVYAGNALTPADFLKFMSEALEKGVDPKHKLADEEARKKEAAHALESGLKELAPDSFEKSLLLLAGKMVWAKPRRKDYQSRSYYHAERLLREIGARIGLSLQQVRSLPSHAVKAALQGAPADAALADRIYTLHVCVPGDTEPTILSGEEAAEFVRTEVKTEAVHASSESELKGTTARKGKATGTVRIVNKAEDMGKMQDGDILISIATTPSVVPAMKKAAAIATDEGGLTCHAAIVSRELGIPCVVGLKIATEVFKDGDTVEVDADAGVVRIIQKNTPHLPTELKPPFPHAWQSAHWTQVGRWVQTPLTYSFFIPCMSTESARRLYPGHAWNTVFAIDHYFYTATEDLSFITDELVRMYADGSLASFVASFDALGNKYLAEYRRLFDTNEVDTTPLATLLALHKELNGFWSFVTYIGDGAQEAALRAGVTKSEAEFFDLVHPYLRLSWIEEEEHLMREIAAHLVSRGVETFTYGELANLRESDAQMDEYLSTYEKRYAWVGINKWESEPYTGEQIATRLNEVLQNTRQGNYLARHEASDAPENAMVGIAASTAYWRATCSGLAEELAYRVRERMTALVAPYGLTYVDALLMTYAELSQLEETKELPVSRETLEKRKEGYAVYCEPDEGKLMAVEGANESYRALRAQYAKSPEAAPGDALRGVVAKKGRVEGKVCIVAGNADFPKFTAGDILVAPETTPAYVPLMKKAAAILTERGGITSHAAIVSRELGVPCIISITGLITTLKDGDTVEVDADAGIIRKK